MKRERREMKRRRSSGASLLFLPRFTFSCFHVFRESRLAVLDPQAARFSGGGIRELQGTQFSVRAAGFFGRGSPEGGDKADGRVLVLRTPWCKLGRRKM